jgi:hypothetical protein
MAAISGYGATLAGAALGALTQVEEITVGGLTVDFSEVKQVSDTNRIPTNLPLTVREAPLEVRFTYDKTVYDTLRDAAKARTEDTFTLTDSGSSTHVGLGYVASVAGQSLGTEGHSVFTVTLQPKTSWTFTA